MYVCQVCGKNVGVSNDCANGPLSPFQCSSITCLLTLPVAHPSDYLSRFCRADVPHPPAINGAQVDIRTGIGGHKCMYPSDASYSVCIQGGRGRVATFRGKPLNPFTAVVTAVGAMYALDLTPPPNVQCTWAFLGEHVCGLPPIGHPTTAANVRKSGASATPMVAAFEHEDPQPANGEDDED